MIVLALLFSSAVHATEDLYQCGECGPQPMENAMNDVNVNISFEREIFEKLENDTVFKNCPLAGIRFCQICYVKMAPTVNESDSFPFIYEMGCIKNESGIINLKFLNSDITKIKEHNGQQVTPMELSESKLTPVSKITN
jgi:hypothetical protein